jgi:hypothetical protein
MQLSEGLFSVALLATSICMHEDMQRCLATVGDAERLACYDSFARKQCPSGSSQSSPSALDTAALSFGLGRQPQVEWIESVIPGVFRGWQAGVSIDLANGQRWQIADNSSASVYRIDAKVRIRRGLLGAFYLEVEGLNHSPRVIRLK